jgi:hypothetical protein
LNLPGVHRTPAPQPSVTCTVPVPDPARHALDGGVGGLGRSPGDDPELAHLCGDDGPLTGRLGVGNLGGGACLGILYTAGHQRRCRHHIGLRNHPVNTRHTAWDSPTPYHTGEPPHRECHTTPSCTGGAACWGHVGTTFGQHPRGDCSTNDTCRRRVAAVGRTGEPTGEKPSNVDAAEVEAMSRAASSEGTRNNASRAIAVERSLLALH